MLYAHTDLVEQKDVLVQGLKQCVMAGIYCGIIGTPTVGTVL